MVAPVVRPGAKRRSAPAGVDVSISAPAANCLDVIEVSSETLLESVADGLVVIDGSGVIRAVNSHAATMFGYGRNDLIDRPVEDLIPLPAREVHPSDVQGYLAHPTDRPMGEGLELSGLRKDGSEFPVDISLSAMQTRQGRFVCASVRDVTYSRLAAIVDSSTDAIIGTLLDGTITSWNAGAEELYGFSAAEMIGRDHSAITPARLRGELPTALQHIGDGERLAHYVTQRSRRDGTVVDVSITVSAVRSRSGDVIGASTVARDVTEDMRNEAELAHQSDQLFVVAQDLAAALARAEQMEASYRVLLDQLPDTATFVFDSDRRLSAASGSSFMAAIVDLSELAGKTVDEAFDHDGSALMHGYLDTAFAGRTADAEVAVDSPQLICHVHASLLPSQPGDTLAKVMVVIRDISASKQREDLLARSEERWRAVFDAAPVGIAELGTDGTVIARNLAIGDLLEVPAGELVGTMITRTTTPTKEPVGNAAWWRSRLVGHWT